MNEATLSRLIEKVQANKKYQTIHPVLVKNLCQDTLAKGGTGKTAMKTVRNKLHQIGGAYFRQPIDYSALQKTLIHLPKTLSDPALKTFCREVISQHASTAERRPILETFFKTCLADLAPVESILDLACGMNPLTAPWMPLAPNAAYLACDIYLDMLDFINIFFDHTNLSGKAWPCDLLSESPSEPAQVAFLLKTIPCLEQVDKEIGLRLLQNIPAAHILVSFPVQSLGGRRKGMPDYYRNHFLDMIADQNWQVRSFTFQTELAFLVTK